MVDRLYIDLETDNNWILFSYDVKNRANLAEGGMLLMMHLSLSVDNILICIILHILLYLIQ